MITGWRAMHDLMGQRVTVWMDLDPAAYRATVVGKLTSLSPDGEFDVLDDEGIMHYCWPALGMEPTPS